jgi:hypothetical protein
LEVPLLEVGESGSETKVASREGEIGSKELDGTFELDTARPLALGLCEWRDGPFRRGDDGIGEETTRGISSPCIPEASSAALARRLSATNAASAEFADGFLLVIGRCGATEAMADRGLAFSSCFFAVVSSLSMMADALTGQML